LSKEKANRVRTWKSPTRVGVRQKQSPAEANRGQNSRKPKKPTTVRSRKGRKGKRKIRAKRV